MTQRVLKLSRDAIKESGFTQRSLGRAAGFHESIISRATFGRWNFKPEERAQIAKVLRRPEYEVFYAGEILGEEHEKAN